MTETERNKLAIAEAMKTLMRSNPIEKITIRQIQEAAGVSRRSFYRYFRDKFDLLEWIYNYEFCRYVEVLPEKSIWDYYPDILKGLRSDPAFYYRAFSFQGQNSFRSFCFEKLFPLIMNDFGDVFPNTETARFVVRRYVYAFFDGYLWWLGSKNPMPWEEFEKLSKTICRAAVEGVALSFRKEEMNRLAEREKH